MFHLKKNTCYDIKFGKANIKRCAPIVTSDKNSFDICDAPDIEANSRLQRLPAQLQTFASAEPSFI